MRGRLPRSCNGPYRECYPRPLRWRRPNVLAGRGRSTRRRLRHEKYAAGWKQILDKKAVTKFVEQYTAWDPNEPAAAACAFTRWAAERNITQVDEERIAEVLPVAFAAKAAAARAQDWLARATALRDEIGDAAPEKERELWGGVVKARNDAVARARGAITTSVREALNVEVMNWEQREAADKAKREADEKQADAMREANVKREAAERNASQRKVQEPKAAKANIKTEKVSPLESSETAQVSWVWVVLVFVCLVGLLALMIF